MFPVGECTKDFSHVGHSEGELVGREGFISEDRRKLGEDLQQSHVRKWLLSPLEDFPVVEGPSGRTS